MPSKVMFCGTYMAVRTCLPTDWMMLYRLLSTPTMTTTVPLAPPKVDLISTARSEESGTTKSGEQW